MTQRITITVTEGGLGYQGDIPEGIEVEIRDYRADSIRTKVQLGEQLGQDSQGHCYVAVLFPIDDLPF